MPMPETAKLMSTALARLSEINSEYFRNNGDLPASLIIAPAPLKDGKTDIEILPLESLVARPVRDMIRKAVLTVTCIEGYLAEQPIDAPWLNPETVPDHPDARHCIVYLAQTFDGARVCAVQYILKPEHGTARLSPLSVLTGKNVALMDSEIADMTRPGRSLQ